MQTIKQTVQLTCPKCHLHDSKQIYQRLFIDELPKLKSKIIDGTLFTHTCTHCKHTYATPYSFMYYSSKHKQMIICAVTEKEYQTVLSLEKSGDISKQYMDIINTTGSLRIVKSPIELAEKVSIEESHYDDRIMEILKYDLMKSLEDHHEDVLKIFYKKSKDDNQFAIVRSNGKISMIKFEDRWYQTVAKKYMPYIKDTRKQIIVDDIWAKNFVKPLPFEEEGEAVSIS